MKRVTRWFGKKDLENKCNKEKMCTIKDFIKKNENCKIVIMESFEIFDEIIYEGMLYDVPEELRDFNIVCISKGVGVAKKINGLYNISISSIIVTIQRY